MPHFPRLMVDPERMKHSGMTGIYVRAADAEGRFGTHDIAVLTRESLFQWLRSDGGANVLAENVVGILLLHGHIVPEGELAGYARGLDDDQ